MIYTPVLVVTGLALALYRVHLTEVLFVLTYGLAVLEGAFGMYKHFGGVKSHVGGFKLRNFIAGPPVVLPTMYVALALFGLLVYYWDEIWPLSKPYIG